MFAYGSSSLLSRSTVSFALGFFVFYVVVAIYLSQQCYRDPSSVFFRPSVARVLSYSAVRAGQARNFAEEKAAERYPLKWPGQSKEPPELCVAISSVSRGGFSYLKDTVGSILEGLDPSERERLFVVVFLAHTDQSQHEEFGQPWLRNTVDSLPTYPKRNGELMSLVRDLEEANDYPAHARKQKIDYGILLEECAQFKPRYTVTLEDDVVAMDGWFQRTLNALRVAEEESSRLRPENGSDFLYLRIFYDNRLLGWNSEEWLVYLRNSTLVLLTVTSLTMLLRVKRSPLRNMISPAIAILICGVCTPMLISLFFAAGRTCMFPRAAGVSLMQNYGCCGQGLVYPQSVVDNDLIPMFKPDYPTYGAVDSFLEGWAKEQDKLRFAVTPVLIQHVGAKSSHGAGDQIGGKLNDDMPFDYPFELNDAAVLAQEHRSWLEYWKGQASS